MKSVDKTIFIELQTELGELRLDDFLGELEALKVALRETERLMSGRDPSLYFTIKRLSKNSPTFVELEAESAAEDDRSEPRFASFVVRRFTTNLTVIGRRKRPRKIDVPTLAAYEELTRPIEKNKVSVTVRTADQSVTINQEFREAIRAVIGEDEISYGSLSGRIEGMTTHSRNSFHLYPRIGPPRIMGFFRNKNRARFAAGMDQYVTVWGQVKYKTWDKFPYEILADDIEVHGVEAPSVLAMKGVAPNATGNLTVQEFLDDLRDE